jgi:hypothetical protein
MAPFGSETNKVGHTAPYSNSITALLSLNVT